VPLPSRSESTCPPLPPGGRVVRLGSSRSEVMRSTARVNAPIEIELIMPGQIRCQVDERLGRPELRAFAGI